MRFTTQLLTGLAELLAAAGAGEWQPSGARTGTPVPWITLSNMPESPDSIICLTAYNTGQDGATTDTMPSIQVRTRGDRAPSTSMDLQDAVFDALHGRRRTLLGTAPNQVLIAQCMRRNLGQLGPDSISRWEWVSTYDVNVNRANANLTVDA